MHAEEARIGIHAHGYMFECLYKKKLERFYSQGANTAAVNRVQSVPNA